MRLRYAERSGAGGARAGCGFGRGSGPGCGTGGAAVAAAAGVRRTETAYPRFVQAQNGYDLVTGGFAGNIDPGRALARMEALPEVAQWARVDVAASSAILPSGRVAPAPELMAVTDVRGRAGFR